VVLAAVRSDATTAGRESPEAAGAAGAAAAAAEAPVAGALVAVRPADEPCAAAA
jgi:hypothetical protein